MNKIRIIDLLNKIANGEEVPEKIKYLNYEYKFNKEDKEYQRDYKGYNYGLGEDRRLDIILDDEVEIIEEEHKIPEKLGYFDLTKDKNEKDENGNDLELHYTGVADTFDDVYEKINDILDYLNYLKSKGE